MSGPRLLEDFSLLPDFSFFCHLQDWPELELLIVNSLVNDHWEIGTSLQQAHAHSSQVAAIDFGTN